MSEVCGNPECGAACSKDKVCSKCKSTPYCSRDCQVKHWKVHKKICGSLNAGSAQQLNHPDHDRYKQGGKTMRSKLVSAMTDFSPACTEIHRLWAVTTKEDGEDVLEKRVAEMLKLASKVAKEEMVPFLHVVVSLLLRVESWQVRLPVSPLLVLIQAGVDVNYIPPKGEYTCLGLVAAQDSAKGKFQENQVTIGRQLIEGGADVNIASKEAGYSPLLDAVASKHCTNLEFVELLLQHGADPNYQDRSGKTPLMATVQMSMPAAIFMLKFDHKDAVTPDVNISDYDGVTMLGHLRGAIFAVTIQRESLARTGEDRISDKDWKTTEQYDSLLAQFYELESMLVARGAVMGGPSKKYEKCDEWVPWHFHLTQIRSVEQPDEDSSMDCDVSCLFGMDILRDAKAPSWCTDGQGRCAFYVHDQKALQFEAHEKQDHMHSAGGRKPAVGQRVKVTVNLPTGSCRLDGYVLDLFRLPSDTDLRRSKRSTNPSVMYENPCLCSDPDCGLTRTGKRFDILRKFGALHGQQVKCMVKLAKVDRNNPPFVSFFGAAKKYDIVLRCNDNHANMWEMARIDPHESKEPA